MADHSLMELFHRHRFPAGVSLLFCALYTPVGVLLATVRVFICLQALLAFSLLHSAGTLRSLVVRVMSLVLGLGVRCDRKSTPVTCSPHHLLVANRLSWLDPLAVQIATSCDTVCAAGVPSVLRSALRLRCLSSADAVRQCLQGGAGEPSTPLLLQPEGTDTSGRAGLLRFSSQLVPTGTAIQPVALSARRLPFCDVTLSTLTSSAVSDLLYFLFVPFTRYTVSFLEPLTLQENEEVSGLVERARQAIASHLGIAATKFTAADKAELVKLTRFCSPAASSLPSSAAAVGSGVRSRQADWSRSTTASTTTTTGDVDRQRMAARVKEVLPHVPLPTILADLRKTGCVDRTISGILEGVVAFVPEAVVSTLTAAAGAAAAASTSPPASSSAAAVPQSAASSRSGSSHPFYTGADSFARDSSQRHLSFQQRKQRLLESARRRYIEKHGLLEEAGAAAQ